MTPTIYESAILTQIAKEENEAAARKVHLFGEHIGDPIKTESRNWIAKQELQFEKNWAPGMALLSHSGKIPQSYLPGNKYTFAGQLVQYVGTSPSSNPSTGDYYIDANTFKQTVWDGTHWIQMQDYNAYVPYNQNSVTSINGMTRQVTLEKVEDPAALELRLLKKIIFLKQSGVITIEKAFNMQLMVLSEDDENRVVVQEIIKNLENKQIEECV